MEKNLPSNALSPERTPAWSDCSSVLTQCPAHSGQPCPHRFYYTPGFPEYPQQAYALESMQWRHHAEKEFFEGEIFAEHGTDEVGEALECTIHADNLPDPIRATVPVRIAVEDVSVWDSASALVEGVGKNG